MNVAPSNLQSGKVYDILMNGRVRATGTFTGSFYRGGIMEPVSGPYPTFLVVKGVGTGAGAEVEERSYPPSLWKFREHKSTNTVGGRRKSMRRKNTNRRITRKNK